MYNPNILEKDTHGIPVTETATSGEDAVINIAAKADEAWVIDCIDWSYDADPTDGYLTIKINNVIVWQIHITTAGPGAFRWGDGPIYTPVVNQAVVVTLSDGSVNSTLNVRYK